MIGRTIQLRSPLVDNATRAGEFELMPTNPVPPFINSQPIKNLNQYTWVTSIRDGVPQYQQITPSFNVVRMLQGTAFSFQVRVSDPAQVNDNSDLSDISYKWKKDEGLIYNINRLNGGTGIAGILIDSGSCTPLISGQYTCEISNQYGSIETEPLQIEVIDPINYPKLYKNLIVNSDGEGGLNGWQGDPSIFATSLVKDPFHILNFGSFRLAGFATFTEDSSSAEPTSIPKTFRFGQSSNDTLFYKKYTERIQSDPSVSNTFAKSDPTRVPDQDQWLTSALLPQIVANEDYNRSSFGGFFPGVAWMDAYNKNDNTNLIGLLPEFTNTSTTYFGRNPIKFQRYGGKSTVLMSQTISVEDVADMVDGSVYGVQYLTSQFFAYVGAGITDYKIKVQTAAQGERILNYYVADSEQMYNRIIEKENGLFPEVGGSELGAPQSRIQLIQNSDIEIIPQCYDKTIITLTYLDSNGRELKSETINGPDERDLWAIKEKAYFPATLYGLFEFIEPKNNTIKVFGQKYTDTNALAAFFEPNRSGVFGKTWSDPGVVPPNLTDKAVTFLLNKYDWRKWRTPYPGTFYYAQNQTKNFFDKALPDYGAAAMFGVGRDVIIPKRTRSIRIQVSFTHESEMFYDSDPKLKGWKSEELYANEYGLSDPTSYRLMEYGTPRCGITKMKLILAPNNIEISDKYLTYSLPPESATVLGLQKNRYDIQDAFNTADASQFTYNFIQPTAVPAPPPSASLFVSADLLASYAAGEQQLTSQATENEGRSLITIDPNTAAAVTGALNAVSN